LAQDFPESKSMGTIGTLIHAVIFVCSRCIERCQHCSIATLTFRHSNVVAGVFMSVCAVDKQATVITVIIVSLKVSHDFFQ
jgi:hypothetical protein